MERKLIIILGVVAIFLSLFGIALWIPKRAPFYKKAIVMTSSVLAFIIGLLIVLRNTKLF